MNDDQITQSVNQIVNQDNATTAAQPAQASNYGLGTDPASITNTPTSDPGLAQPQPVALPNDSTIANQPVLNSPSTDQAQPTTATDSAQMNGSAQIDHSNDQSNSELTTIKQQALSQLAPIVHKLDQSPEDKYRTLMMMIQAGDDQTLIKSAYEAANQIQDDVKKAEALLGIVN